jgi:hypothetical protein
MAASKGRLGELLVAAVLAGSAIAHADDWQFIPKTPEEAALAESFGVVPTRILEARLFYEDQRQGGSVTGLTLRTTIPMPYVLVPGVRFANIYSLVRVDLPILSVDSPATGLFGGIGDVHFVDGAVKYWKNVAVGAGFGATLPSATHAGLGTGKLTLGPLLGVSVWLVRDVLSISVIAENLFSIAGPADRPDVDVLLLQPSLLLNLPHAFFLESDPILVFEWTRGGHPTIPVNLGVGHAFSKRLVVTVEPEWIASGDRRNDVLVRLIVSYVGW